MLETCAKWCFLLHLGAPFGPVASFLGLFLFQLCSGHCSAADIFGCSPGRDLGYKQRYQQQSQSLCKQSNASRSKLRPGKVPAGAWIVVSEQIKLESLAAELTVWAAQRLCYPKQTSVALQPTSQCSPLADLQQGGG